MPAQNAGKVLKIPKIFNLAGVFLFSPSKSKSLEDARFKNSCLKMEI
jgi:hypothetical protein